MANRFILKNRAGKGRGSPAPRSRASTGTSQNNKAQSPQRRPVAQEHKQIEALTATMQKVNERDELMAPARRAGALRQQIFSATKTEVCLSVQVIC
jgi:hypothetical protein